MRFSGHPDSAYVDAETPHDPYLTCWCTLDDMTFENGTFSVLPFSRADGCGRHAHVEEARTNDLVGYTGDDPGELVVVPAGSIAFFTSFTLYRSGANVTGKPRRSYLIQCSNEVIRKADFNPLRPHRTRSLIILVRPTLWHNDRLRCRRMCRLVIGAGS
jgi:ectoine hydroxylase-related dioxygenase (phytanoyl-CoA dioxygenase family)